MVDHADTSNGHRPVLPGMHPDPSICRVGDVYYVANSSFEYVPGVPIHRSSDLRTWELIGHALSTEDHLVTMPGIDGASRGIYAPTLRHHDGTFYLVTTDLGRVRDGHIIVHTTDPAGPWSTPVSTRGAIGIDPDLVWDDAGVCYLTWRDLLRGGISQAIADPLTGALLSEPQKIWDGTGLSETEGPHLYCREGWWYLVAAEGGTHTGHSVVVARSRSASGPFEPHPSNPIFSHRSTSHPVQGTGHADLVERADGSWAAVYHGIRQRGSFPRYHVTGRETFVAGVTWVDGWPVIDVDGYPSTSTPTGFVDEFASPTLHARWVSPGRQPAAIAATGEGQLRIVDDGHRTPICSRVLDHEWTASVAVVEGSGSLVLRVDSEHELSVSRDGRVVTVDLIVGPARTRLAETSADTDARLILAARPSPARGFRAGPDRIGAGVSDGDTIHWLAEIDGRYLSTEVAGGFTGRMIGLRPLGDEAWFGPFSYTPTQPDRSSNIAVDGDV